MSDVRARFVKIVMTQLCIEESEIRDDSDFAEDLDADRLNAIELVEAAEDEFDVEFSDEDVEQIRTFGQAVACIERRLG